MVEKRITGHDELLRCVSQSTMDLGARHSEGRLQQGVSNVKRNHLGLIWGLIWGSSISWALIWGSSIWVYLDATKHKIGKIPSGKGMFNMSAGGWAIVTLLLWIIGFPAYLIKRGSLIEAARANPVNVSGRGGKAAALTVGGVVSIMIGYGSLVDAGLMGISSLPACDSRETKSLVGQIVNDMPLVKALGARFVSVKDIAEQGYNTEVEVRSCAGTLVTTAGEDLLQYSVSWSDRVANEFYVQAQIVSY